MLRLRRMSAGRAALVPRPRGCEKQEQLAPQVCFQGKLTYIEGKSMKQAQNFTFELFQKFAKRRPG